MEFRQPTEKLSLYRLVTPPNGDATSTKIPWLEAQNSQNGLYDWFRSDLAADSQPVAENILAIFVQPVWPMPGKDTGADTSAAPNYLYDTRRHQWPDTTTMAERSRHQLPPMIRLTLVAWMSATGRSWTVRHRCACHPVAHTGQYQGLHHGGGV